ncbi:MAG: DUF192 domain-containing protein [Anaerolineaceae bacterium]|nr:DUF192 domain-containing protein [Anaerolineaceae bacterium]
MKVGPRTALNVGLLVVLAAVVVFGASQCNNRRRSQANRSGPGPQTADRRGQPPLRTITIRVGLVPVVVEVADDPREQARGYMFRDPPEKTGMLFVWPDEEPQAFWMKNVDWDLDLAYIAGDGTIRQIELMKAFDERGVPSRRPARYVLEMPAGRFAALGIKVGEVVTFPPELSTQHNTKGGR